MSAEWVAVAGTLLGTLGGLAGGVWVERIRTDEARKGREEVRRDARDDLQRSLLFEVQDLLAAYVRVLGRIFFSDQTREEAGNLRPGRRQRLDPQLDEQALQMSSGLRRLASRVLDQQLRDHIQAFRRIAMAIEERKVDNLDEAYAIQEALEERLGTLLRDLL